MRCVEQVGGAIDEAAGAEPLYLPAPDKAAALVRLEREVARLRALQLRILAVSDEVAAETGARSAGAWLGQQVPLGYAEAGRTRRLAVALEVNWRQVGAAFAAGRLTEAQAETIVRALDALPESAGQELRERAEAHLSSHAAHLDPRQLRLLGRRVLELMAPDVVEAQEYRLLLAEEQRARQDTRSLASAAEATAPRRFVGACPDQVASRLRIYLDAISSPRRLAGKPDDRPRLIGPRRLGEAFCALIERLPDDVCLNTVRVRPRSWF